MGEAVEGNFFRFFKVLDFFPKTSDPCKKTSVSGGAVSVICWFVIASLVYSEVNDFLHPGTKFRFRPDTDLTEKIELNLDFTVASPCKILGADVVDSTDQSAVLFGKLQEEETWFDLDSRQRSHFDILKNTNRYLGEQYHALKNLIWKSSYDSYFAGMPSRLVTPRTSKDACRFYGKLTLNKVAGNFHVTAGKVLPIAGAHVHVGALMPDLHVNFTHRIEKFSFGPSAKGILQPLEGEEKIDPAHRKYQYWLQVVPTDIRTSYTRLTTHQYSVRDYERPIQHGQSAGIFFKYDFSAMRVLIQDDREYLAMFLARVSSIVGGIYVTVGIINGTLQFLWNLVTCRGLVAMPK